MPADGTLAETESGDDTAIGKANEKPARPSASVARTCRFDEVPCVLGVPDSEPPEDSWMPAGSDPLTA